MYHEAAKKNGQYFRGFYPPQKAFFPTPGSSLSFTKIVATLQKLWLLFALPKQRGCSSSFQMQEPQFLKWSHNFWKTQITHLEMTICFNQATRLFIIISNAGATIFEMEPQFLKWSHNFWKTQITHLEITICFNQATRLFIIISNAVATIFVK